MKLSLLGRRPGQPPRVNDDVPMAEKLGLSICFCFFFIGEKPWNFQQCKKRCEIVKPFKVDTLLMFFFLNLLSNFG